MKRGVSGVGGWWLVALALAAPCSGQWTNPNPTGAVNVAVMSDTNGNITAPRSLSYDRATLSEISLASQLINSWDDISTLAGTYLLTAGNAGTAPSAPYALMVLEKSGSQVRLYGYLKGEGGITVTNDANGTGYITGNPTNGVEAFFPASGTSGVGRFYYRLQALPNNVSYLDLLNTTNGTLYWNGTNFVFGTLTNAIGTATNTVLFGGLPTTWFDDFFNQTNFLNYDDGSLVAADFMGFDWGTNLSIVAMTVTNGSRTGTIYRVNAGVGTASNTLLYSVNTWAESNSFQKAVDVPRLLIVGNGNSMTGVSATVGVGGTNNTASGFGATASGGRANTASGQDATVGGGSANAATDSGTTVGGGRGNTASGPYSTVSGGDDNGAAGQYAAVFGGHDVDASASRSAVFGEYATNAKSNVVLFAWGQAATNKTAATLTNSGVEVFGDIKGTRVIGDGSLLTGLPGSSVSNAVSTVATDGETGTPLIVRFHQTTSTTAGTTMDLWPLGGGGAGSFTGLVSSTYTSAPASNLTMLGSGGLSITHAGQNGNSTMTLAYTESGFTNSIASTASNAFMQASASNAFMQASASNTFVKRSGYTDNVILATAPYVTAPDANMASNGQVVNVGTFFANLGSGAASNAIAKIINPGSPITTNSGVVILGFSHEYVTNVLYTTNAQGQIIGTPQFGITNPVFGFAHNPGTNGANGLLSGRQNVSTAAVESVVCGGVSNTVGGQLSAIVGGSLNAIANNSAYNNFIGGGSLNDTAAGAIYCTIGGGLDNDVSGQRSTIVGGTLNDAAGNDTVIAGGNDNDITTGTGHVIAGGVLNLINYLNYAAILGGYGNHAGDGWTVVGGGLTNKAQRAYGFIGGGEGNKLSGDVGDEYWSTIPGGYCNSTSGKWAFAAGRMAQARQNGTFVWNSGAGFWGSTASNQFLINVPGGAVGIGVTNPTAGTVSMSGPAVVGSTASVPAVAGAIAFDAGTFRVCATAGTWSTIGLAP